LKALGFWRYCFVNHVAVYIGHRRQGGLTTSPPPHREMELRNVL
jgi:hypothetical protein